MDAKIRATVHMLTKIARKTKLASSHTQCTCQSIPILMHSGFSTSKVTMTPSPTRETSCPTSEATGSTLSRKSSTPSWGYLAIASNTDKLLEKEAKRATDHSWTAKWGSSRDGIMNKTTRPRPWSSNSSRPSTGKSLAVDLLNMTKVVRIMTTSSRTIRLGSTSSKLSSTTHPKLQFLLIPLGTHRPLWLFLPIWVLKGTLWKGLMSISCSKTRLSSFGKPSQPMGNTTVPFPPISDGPFTDLKISLSEAVSTIIFAPRNKVILTIWDDKMSFWKEFYTVPISWDILGMISSSSISILTVWLRPSWKSFHPKSATKSLLFMATRLSTSWPSWEKSLVKKRNPSKSEKKTSSLFGTMTADSTGPATTPLTPTTRKTTETSVDSCMESESSLSHLMSDKALSKT